MYIKEASELLSEAIKNKELKYTQVNIPSINNLTLYDIQLE